jgi:hypothetical protein
MTRDHKRTCVSFCIKCSLLLSYLNWSLSFINNFTKNLKYESQWKSLQCQPPWYTRVDKQTDGHDKASNWMSVWTRQKWVVGISHYCLVFSHLSVPWDLGLIKYTNSTDCLKFTTNLKRGSNIQQNVRNAEKVFKNWKKFKFSPFTAPVQTGPGAHPASCTMGTGSFPAVESGRGVTLTLDPLRVLELWKGRVIPLLPPRPVRSVQTLSTLQGCTSPLPLHLSLPLPPCSGDEDV